MGGKRLPWAVLGGREPDTLESQSLVGTGEGQTRNIDAGETGKRQAGCVRRTVRELWEEALFEAMALRRLLRGGDV